LSDYYSETESDTKLVGIWPELKAAYTEKTGPSITQTNAEGEILVASLCFDNLQKRDASQERKSTAPISEPSQPDYAKVAKQVRDWSIRFDGGENSFEFFEQVEWPANTYGLDLDMMGGP